MVILEIIGLSKLKGQLVPNTRKLIATVKLENEIIDVNVHNPKYQNRIKDLFFNRHFHEGNGKHEPAGNGRKKGDPGESQFIQEFLPTRLALMGLTFVVKDVRDACSGASSSISQ